MTLQDVTNSLAHVSITQGDGFRSPAPKSARAARRSNQIHTETTEMPVTTTMEYGEWIAAQAVSSQQPHHINGPHQRNLFCAGTTPFMNNYQQFQMMGAAIPGYQGPYGQMVAQQANAHSREQKIAHPALPDQPPSTPSTAQPQSITSPGNNMSPPNIVASAEKIRVMKDNGKRSREISPSKITEATFGSKVTGFTPAKEVKKRIEDSMTMPLVIKERWEKCTGIPVRIKEYYKDGFGSRKSRVCSICKADTRWYCFGCKSWFCVSQGRAIKGRKVTYVKQIIGGKEVVFELSCFHQKHKAAWEEEAKNDEENSVSKESENDDENEQGD